MRKWYCAKCRITFQVKPDTSVGEKCGCPECFLWFRSTAKDSKSVAMSVTPEDLARHKLSRAPFEVYDFRRIGERAVRETTV